MKSVVDEFSSCASICSNKGS